MDGIDARDLPEDQAQLVAAFVEFLRHKLRTPQAVRAAETDEQGWGEGTATIFAKDWDDERDAIYGNWREHYHVPGG